VQPLETYMVTNFNIFDELSPCNYYASALVATN
jgi:hypothetical protein